MPTSPCCLPSSHAVRRPSHPSVQLSACRTDLTFHRVPDPPAQHCRIRSFSQKANTNTQTHTTTHTPTHTHTHTHTPLLREHHCTHSGREKHTHTHTHTHKHTHTHT